MKLKQCDNFGKEKLKELIIIKIDLKLEKKKQKCKMKKKYKCKQQKKPNNKLM